MGTTQFFRRTADGLKLLADAKLERVQELEGAACSAHLTARLHHRATEVHSTLAAKSPVVALYSSSRSSLKCLCLDKLDLRRRVGSKDVHGNDNSHAELELLQVAAKKSTKRFHRD